MDENKGSGFLLGLLIGSLVGAAVAVLMAPATGEETRKLLKDKLEPAKAKVVDLSGEVRARAGEIAEDMKAKAADLAKDLKDKAEDLWNKGKKTVGEKKEELLEAFSKNPERKHYT